MAGSRQTDGTGIEGRVENGPMRDELYEKVKKYIDAQDMIAAGDVVAAGISGGADSVCLLYILWRLRAERPFRLAVVHVNHGLREEAGEDAAFVKKFCEEWEIPFFLREVDAAGYADCHKLSTEEAGRQLRYQAFEETLTKIERMGMKSRMQAGPENATSGSRRRIAVAHNAQDRAETMLFHLFRGTGLKGLSSIQPVREAVIRPLLQLDRKEIEAYLMAQGLSWREDVTNGEDVYARNRIRHHILPFAEQEICRGAVAHMGELADLLAETEDYLARETKRLYESCLAEAQDAAAGGQTEQGENEMFQAAAGHDRKFVLRIDRLKGLEPVMQKRVLFYALEQVIPYRKDITARHIEGLLALTKKGGSGSLSLLCGIRVYKEYDTLRFGRAREDKENTLSDAGVTYTLWEKGAIPEDSLFYKKEQNIPENRYTKWFDYDKITTALLLRPRREGDYLTIDDALHTQSLKRYLINEKIPKETRDKLYVLADGSHVLWVPGYRTSSGFHVSGETKRVLEVHFEDKKKNCARAERQSDKGENDGGENRGIVDGRTG